MAVTWLATIVSRRVEGKRKISVVNLTTAASGNTYTTGGDAPPAFGELGMKRNIENIVFVDTSAEGLLYQYDRTNNKIKIFYGDNDAGADGVFAQLASAAAHNSKSVFVEVIGW